jgi:SAM-dependent methyltransferase
MTVPERIRWAVETVDPREGERILEFGCGPGVAAELVGRRLGGGALLAVDRSAVAVGRARGRTADLPAVEIRQSTVADLDVPAASFDKAFGVNVNVFWTGAATAELTVLAAALRRGGQLFVLYGGGPTGADRVTAGIAAKLSAHGFTDVRTLRADAGLGVVALAS